VRCDNGRCILKSRVCDGNNDCGGGDTSDEAGCGQRIGSLGYSLVRSFALVKHFNVDLVICMWYAEFLFKFQNFSPACTKQ